MPGASEGERRAAYTAMAQTLAALHQVDFRSVGLQSYGRHSGYCSRQVSLLAHACRVRWKGEFISFTSKVTSGPCCLGLRFACPAEYFKKFQQIFTSPGVCLSVLY
jgi:hypothetical protein